MSKKQKQIKTKRESTCSIQETHRELLSNGLLTGDQKPHVLLAFWAALLSNQVELPLNCKYVRILVDEGYLENGLPDEKTLLEKLGKSPDANFPQGLMGKTHIDHLYELEYMYHLGMLNFDSGDTLESQREWRDALMPAIKGFGPKLMSWAHFIYHPLTTKIMTIDRHHAARLGVKADKLGDLKFYCTMEDRMIGEAKGLYPDYDAPVTAAMLWENHRIAKGLVFTEDYTSHAGISCRWY